MGVSKYMKAIDLLFYPFYLFHLWLKMVLRTYPKINATSTSINPIKYGIAAAERPLLPIISTPRCRTAKNKAITKNWR